jgi:hypothetical protein
MSCSIGSGPCSVARRARSRRTHIGMTGLIAADRADLIAICVTDLSSLRRSPFPPVRRCPLGN